MLSQLEKAVIFVSVFLQVDIIIQPDFQVSCLYSPRKCYIIYNQPIKTAMLVSAEVVICHNYVQSTYHISAVCCL